MPSWTEKLQSLHPLWAAVLTSALATGASHLLPADLAGTAVGFVFLGATYLLALARPRESTRIDFALHLGGLLDTVPLSWPRLLRAARQTLTASALVMGVIIPGTWVGFQIWYAPTTEFDLRAAFAITDSGLPAWTFIELALGHLLAVALPEEAFFRGYLQSSLDARWPGRVSVLGTQLGWSLLATSALFALGHYLTINDPTRLAVFFPSLLFGFLRAKMGGIGAATLVHALCNLLIITLLQGYGLG